MLKKTIWISLLLTLPTIALANSGSVDLPECTCSLSGLPASCSMGEFVTAIDANGNLTCGAAAGGGTVTSVGLADDSTNPLFTISGSPVTSSGTIGETLVNFGDHMVLAGPTSGPSAQPSPRLLVNSDIPNYYPNPSPSPSNYAVVSNGTIYVLQPYTSGTVTGVTASLPLLSSGGSAPVISVSPSPTFIGTVTAGNYIDSGATASTPAIFNSSKQLSSGSYSGNTTELATASGTLTSGHCADFDSNGNVVDAGGACNTSPYVLPSPSPSAGVLTANGSTYVLNTYTPGSVIFAGSNGGLNQNNADFFWDNTNNTLGLGGTPQSASILTGFNNAGAARPIWLFGYGASSYVGIRGDFAEGTMGSPSAALANDVLDYISGRGYGTTGFAAASTGVMTIIADATFSDSSMPTDITFKTTPTGSTTSAEVMRIDATGYVGIGTTSPAENFEVVGTTGDAPRGIVSTQYSSTANGGAFFGRHARGTASSPLALNAGDSLSGWGAFGYNGSGWSPSVGGISVIAAQAFTTANNGTEMTFSVTPDNSTTPSTPMYLMQSGDLVLGSSTDGTGLLQVNGTSKIVGSSGAGVEGLGTIPSAAAELVVDAALGTTTGIGQTGVAVTLNANSTATTDAIGVSSTVNIDTAASSLIDGVLIQNPTLTNGATVTSVRGISIGALSAGTNNYGVYTTVGSGSTNFNIYANGTANNYFAGNVGIGTSVGDAPLEILATVPQSATTSLLGSVADFHGSVINDTTGSGTIANRMVVSIGKPTFESTSAETITTAATLYIAAAPSPSPSVTITNAYAIDVASGAVNFAGALTVGGSVTLNGLTNADTGDYVCYNSGVIEYDATACVASDAKIKENVEPLTDGLKEVLALKPVAYDLKPEYNKHGLGRQVGFIAQEVDKVDPRVTDSSLHQDLMKVNYEHMVAILTKAIQEQQEEIDDLKKKCE